MVQTRVVLVRAGLAARSGFNGTNKGAGWQPAVAILVVLVRAGSPQRGAGWQRAWYGLAAHSGINGTNRGEGWQSAAASMEQTEAQAGTRSGYTGWHSGAGWQPAVAARSGFNGTNMGAGWQFVQTGVRAGQPAIVVRERADSPQRCKQGCGLAAAGRGLGAGSPHRL